MPHFFSQPITRLMAYPSAGPRRQSRPARRGTRIPVTRYAPAGPARELTHIRRARLARSCSTHTTPPPSGLSPAKLLTDVHLILRPYEARFQRWMIHFSHPDLQPQAPLGSRDGTVQVPPGPANPLVDRVIHRGVGTRIDQGADLLVELGVLAVSQVQAHGHVNELGQARVAHDQRVEARKLARVGLLLLRGHAGPTAVVRVLPHPPWNAIRVPAGYGRDEPRKQHCDLGVDD